MQCEQLFQTAMSEGTTQCEKDAICNVGTLTDHTHALCRQHAIEFVCYISNAVTPTGTPTDTQV